MTTLEFFGIYSADIERFCEYLDAVMEEMGFTDSEIDVVYDYTTATFNDMLKSGSITLDNFSVQLMRQMAYETVAELSVKFPNERFDYEIVNVLNAHLVVNGEVLETSESIKDLLNEYYTDEPIEFTSDVIRVEKAEMTNRNDSHDHVVCKMSVSDDLIDEMLMRTDIEDIEARVLADEDLLVDVHLHRFENNAIMYAVLPNDNDLAEIPLTAEEKQQIMKITQGAFDKAYTAAKPKTQAERE